MKKFLVIALAAITLMGGAQTVQKIRSSIDVRGYANIRDSVQTPHTITSEVAGNDHWTIRQDANSLGFQSATLTGVRIQTFQNATGIIALLGDIPATETWAATLTAGAASGGTSPSLTSGDNLLYNVGSGGSLASLSTTGVRTWSLPDATGTIALTSDLIPDDQTLSEVLGFGNTTGANDIDITEGQSIVYNTAAGGPFTGNFSGPTLTAGRTWTLPDNTGTIALTSDIVAASLAATLTVGNTSGGTGITMTTTDAITFGSNGNIAATGGDFILTTLTNADGPFQIQGTTLGTVTTTTNRVFQLLDSNGDNLFRITANGSIAAGYKSGGNGTDDGADLAAVGFESCKSFTTVVNGHNSAGFGAHTLGAITTEINNNAFGEGAMEFLKSSGNVAMGTSALRGVDGSSTGANNSGVGNLSLRDILTGSENAGFGASSLTNLTDGSNNTALGQAAGDILTTGGRNTLIGRNCDVASGGINDAIVLGYNQTATAAGQFIVGNSTARITEVYINNGVTTSAFGSVSIVRINVTGASGTDIDASAGDLFMAPARGTGDGDGGSFFVETAPAGGSGSTLNPLVERMSIGGNGNVTFNETGASVNFRVEGDTDPSVIRTQGSSNRVCIGGTLFTGKFNVNGIADEIQALVQGHSTQTSPIATFETSAGTNVVDIYTDGVGIGNVNPDASALMEMASTTQGFIYPLMTDVQRDAIGSPAEGLHIFDNVNNVPNFYNGTAWRRFTHTTAASFTNGSVVFSTGGSELLDDNANLFWNDADDRLGIGTNSPDVTLDVDGFIGYDNKSSTLGAAATTFTATSNGMTITGDGGANTIATITNPGNGGSLTLIFVDALVTITDDDTHGADSIDLSASFTSADDTVLHLVYDGTSWYEVSRSTN